MTGLATTELTIRRTIELRAPIDRVWRALTDAAELSRWLPQAADLAPGAGAEGWFDWGDLGRYAVLVEAAEAPSRVVWRWARDERTRRNGIAGFLLSQFCEYLEILGFAPWAGFRGDTEWKEVVSKMQVGTQVESVFLVSTDYGMMK